MLYHQWFSALLLHLFKPMNHAKIHEPLIKNGWMNSQMSSLPVKPPLLMLSYPSGCFWRSKTQQHWQITRFCLNFLASCQWFWWTPLEQQGTIKERGKNSFCMSLVFHGNAFPGSWMTCVVLANYTPIFTEHVFNFPASNKKNNLWRFIRPSGWFGNNKVKFTLTQIK